MHLVDDLGEPYVTLFSVQYTPLYSDYPRRPHDAAFRLKRDPKGRGGVFVQPFSYGGIVPVAHVSHEVEAALALGWPELSRNGYLVEFPGYFDDAKGIGSYGAGHESLMELPILMGILELEGLVENAERNSLYGALVIDEKTTRYRSRFPGMSISSSGIGSGTTGRIPSHPRRCRRFPLTAIRTESPRRSRRSSRKGLPNAS